MILGKGVKMSCKIVGRMIDPCDGLKSVIADYYSRSRVQGVVMAQGINMDTYERFNRFQLRSGEYNYKKPILMNFCPFCGGSLVTWKEEDIESVWR
jgi:hypothetical protein